MKPCLEEQCGHVNVVYRNSQSANPKAADGNLRSHYPLIVFWAMLGPQLVRGRHQANVVHYETLQYRDNIFQFTIRNTFHDTFGTGLLVDEMLNRFAKTRIKDLYDQSSHPTNALSSVSMTSEYKTSEGAGRC